MAFLDETLGTLLIGYDPTLTKTNLPRYAAPSGRSWEVSGLFLLELAWAFRYYQHCSEEDAIHLKFIVAITIGIDFVGLLARLINVYQHAVTHWGDTQFQLREHWPVTTSVICGAVIATVVQGYLTCRYVRLTRNWVVGFGLLSLILLQFGSTIAFAILLMERSALDQRTLLEQPVKLWLITDAVVNACIALALIWVLYTHRPVLRRMDTIISRLIMNAFQSGCIPTLFAIATLINYIMSPSSNVFTVFLVPISHLYVLTMLYALNVRKSLRNVSSGALSITDVYVRGGIC